MEFLLSDIGNLQKEICYDGINHLSDVLFYTFFREKKNENHRDDINHQKKMSPNMGLRIWGCNPSGEALDYLGKK
mgnify:CR=1 FL=1